MDIEKYRPSMSGDVLHSWAVDAQKEIDRLQEEVDRLRKYEDAVTSAIKECLLVYNFEDTNCTVVEHKYWLAHLAKIEELESELAASQQEYEILKSAEDCYKECINDLRQEVERLKQQLESDDCEMELAAKYANSDAVDMARKQTAQEIYQILTTCFWAVDFECARTQIKQHYGLEG